MPRTITITAPETKGRQFMHVLNELTEFLGDKGIYFKTNISDSIQQKDGTFLEIITITDGKLGKSNKECVLACGSEYVNITIHGPDQKSTNENNCDFLKPDASSAFAELKYAFSSATYG